MSATFPANVFTPAPAPTGEWISEKTVTARPPVGCYVAMNFEPGATASLETIHECSGHNDWNCPIGVLLELDQIEAEQDAEGDWY